MRTTPGASTSPGFFNNGISAVVSEQTRRRCFNNGTFAVVSGQTRYGRFNNGTFAVVDIHCSPRQSSRLEFQSSVTWRTTPHESHGNSKWKKGN
ncbi:hypothetical protein JI735_02600 [Paenibacillus sonchi]|uniref:Uncharacterized protein n=1 Tax=Paenibacillus sonchi TaxID=373687 RepID=A0A974PD83_9BACL|nr:hypothetical protein JI735_02600 [Paenibacillus sonchi]